MIPASSQTGLGARDPRLSDHDWLTTAYVQSGDEWIAKLLGCDRKTVMAARELHGIPSAPRGPRRGYTPHLQAVPTPASRPISAHPADQRYLQEARPEGPAPSRDYLWARIRAAIEADAANDDHAFEDALLGLSSACKLVWDHRQRLKAA